MSNKIQYFHFTLGPVQSFVSQARRTRDFWAGSFILSWLSAVAMKAVQAQYPEKKLEAVQAQYPEKKLEKVILFPKLDDIFMRYLVGEANNGDPIPKQGSIPNRFKAKVDDNFEPAQVTDAVQEAWKALAELVWEKDLKNLGLDSLAYAIWERQIAAFWDMSWVITDDKEDSAALDRRKNWRTYVRPDEPGVKCSVMEGWQELSGAERPNREKLDAFWKPIRSKPGSLKSDLAEREALCAIAFVKRRFSRHFKCFDHTMKQGWTLKGWEVPSAVPSVTYMAAVCWLCEALDKADKKVLHEFHDAAHALSKYYGEWDTHIACLERYSEFKKLRALDGNVFFSTALENKRVFEDQDKAKIVKKALDSINKTADLEPVSPFYAVLMMDGDSLGKQMSDSKKQGSITAGLAEFTKGVPNIVNKEHSGFLIYAGGDDVLAILPLEDAIACAAALRSHYLSCFEEKAAQGNGEERIAISTTLSGAIEFAHIDMPLTQVLKDAHELLDKVAKDGSGRDALAIRVWKPGGLQLEWSQPWEIVLSEETGKPIINAIADVFQKNQSKDTDFTSKFFYKIRERFDLLNPAKNKDGQLIAESIMDEKQAIELMTMEYLNSWGRREHRDYDQATQTVSKLLNQCRPRKNPKLWLQVTEADIDKKLAKELGFKDKKEGEDVNDPLLEKFKFWKADGALLVRFLAHKGVNQ